MAWLLAAQAGFQLLQGAVSANEAIKQQTLRNDAIKVYNNQVVAQTAKQLTQLNIQRSVERQRTTDALDGLQRASLAAAGDRGLQAAATDTLGSTVDSLLNDINIQLTQAKNQELRNLQLNEEAFNFQVDSITDNAFFNLENPWSGAGKAEWSAALGSAVGTLGTGLLANKLGGQGWLGNGSTAARPADTAGTALKGASSLRLSANQRLVSSTLGVGG